MDKKKLDALLALLDDPNPEVFQSVTKKLLELPTSVVPVLEDIWLESKNKPLQDRLEEIIKKIEFNGIKKELVKWCKSSKKNLIEGAILVSKSYNPHLLTEPIQKDIQKIKTDVWLELNDRLTALEKVRILNHIFFYIYNYRTLPPNQPTNWDGDISAVLTQKQGNYIIMAILYAGIAQELNIPIYGINLTGSVLLAYEDVNAKAKKEGERPVLFYINPIDRGNVFGHKELEYIIKQKGITNLKKHYAPCPNTTLIKRLLEHQISVYKRLNLNSFIPNFKDLYKCIEQKNPS
ncbi:MAG: transglutaminase family protein [Marinifilaceae bacterium]|jgi:regulator of sirC expression with transglutaminase-like and TPR domain